MKINTIAVILIILTILVGKEFYNFAPILLFSAIAIYAIVGPIYAKKKLHDRPK
jgi:hypothetical protein